MSQFWDKVEATVASLADQAGYDWYGFGSFDVEDVTVLYANRGDPYIKTICAVVRGHKVEYCNAGWGDILEQLELEEA